MKNSINKKIIQKVAALAAEFERNAIAARLARARKIKANKSKNK